MKVYPPRDIRPFIMYCVNGKPRSSLLIESTDSMIETKIRIITTKKRASARIRARAMSRARAMPMTRDRPRLRVRAIVSSRARARAWECVYI